MHANDQFGNNTMGAGHGLNDPTYNSGAGVAGVGAGGAGVGGAGAGGAGVGIPDTTAMHAGASGNGAGNSMTGKAEKFAGAVLGSKSLHAKGVQKEQ